MTRDPSRSDRLAPRRDTLALLALVVACGGVDDQRSAADRAAGEDTAARPAPGTAAVQRSPVRTDDGTLDEELESICEGIRNSLECARAIERDQLPGDGRARRAGDTLFLALTTRDTVRLVDRRGDASAVVRHSYQRRWRGANHFVVHRQYYEGSDYLVVDGRTGQETTVPARPLLSPDGRRFAVLSLDLEAGYSPNTLQLWRLSAGGPELEWATEPEEWGAAEGRWRDDSRLEFTRACGPRSADAPRCGERQELVRTDDGWEIRPAAGAGGVDA